MFLDGIINVVNHFSHIKQIGHIGGWDTEWNKKKWITPIHHRWHMQSPRVALHSSHVTIPQTDDIATTTNYRYLYYEFLIHLSEGVFLS